MSSQMLRDVSERDRKSSCDFANSEMGTKVPFADLRSLHESIRDEITDAIENVVREGVFIRGKYVQSFERNFARYVGAAHCIGVGNGTDAIAIALKMYGLKKDDEVIAPANSFIATAEAITMAGGKIVFADCSERTYNVSAQEIEKVMTSKTKAVLAVHLYGQPADMTPIQAIASKHKILIIEDAAQAHGAQYRQKNAGTFGSCSCFSFFPGKNLGAFGDGGAVLTNDDQLAERIRRYANHGRKEKYDHEFEGVNSRLDGLQAAILDVKLRHLDAWNERRIAIAEKYNRALRDHVGIPEVLPNTKHVYHLYVIRVRNRDRFRQILGQKGIATGIHYPTPLPFLRAYQSMNHRPEDFPVCFKLKEEIASLPIHAAMTDEQVGYVIEQVKRAVVNIRQAEA